MKAKPSAGTTEKKFFPAASAVDSLRQAVLHAVADSPRRLTPGDLTKRLSRSTSASAQSIKKVVRDLVDARELIYTYHFGCTFLERSFNKPTRISHRVVLKPPDIDHPVEGDQVVVNILAGASFGTGEHPSTRLAIRAIDRVLSNGDFLRGRKNLRGLDIGTGSGVLALVAARFGLGQVLGIDIDPCARDEARKNIALNDLAHCIEISDEGVEDVRGRFALITANLRFPTLLRLAARLAEALEKDGVLILSGIKADEVPEVSSAYRNQGLQSIWSAEEKGWTGLVLCGNTDPKQTEQP